jgi:hypothetical protein
MKSWATQNRLYYEERNTGRASGISKDVAGQQKAQRNCGDCEKQQIVTNTIPNSPGW